MILPLSGNASDYAVVTAMITPAFFLTATASLLASSNTRLARVVDRMRIDLAELKTLVAGVQRQALVARIGVHKRRSRLVLGTLRLLYGAVSAFVGTSLGIAVDSLTEFPLAALPTVLAVVGVLLLLAASVNLGLEARLSVRMLDAELDQEFARNPANPPPGND